MRGRLHLEVRRRTGALVAERTARNTVLRSGGGLVAGLFTGGGGSITHMGVGTSDAEPASVTVTALANDDGAGGPGLEGDVTTPIPADAFLVSDDETHQRMVVRVRATLPETAAIGTVREAGLLSRQADGDVLYNRVIFAPIDKGPDHDLTLFWEVEFPYGDLHWLVQ